MVPVAGIRGFLDATDFSTWLKYFRSCKDKQNVKHSLLAGQIFYETVRDIQPGEELYLGPREAIQLDGAGEVDDRDREDIADIKRPDSAGEEDVEGDDADVKCLVCDKIFPDVYV